MYNKIVVGIDQSYTVTAITIMADEVIIKSTTLKFKNCKNKTEKRNKLKETLTNIYNKISTLDAKNVITVVERIRTFSQGGKKGFGLRPNYLITTGALIATIVDIAYNYNYEVYSVDTRSWKSQVLGNSKNNNNYPNFVKPEKAEAILFAESLGIDCKLYEVNGEVKRHKKGKHAGKIVYNDDLADSVCIASYCFIDEAKQKLNKEG